MSHTEHRPSHPFNGSVAQASLFGTLEGPQAPAPVLSPQRQALGFDEPIRGLHVREINGPDALWHFFGPSFDRADVSH